MQPSTNRKRPFALFYMLFAYIMAFTLWWAYLLYVKNETAYVEKVELMRIRFEMSQPAADARYEETEDFKQTHQKYERQRFMIVTEGAVFISLLLFGLMRVRRNFKREMELAEQQKNFLLSVTHELKSPLSSVKLSLQTMGTKTLEPEQSAKLIGNSLTDVSRLESLVDNILFAAKIERDTHGLAHEDLNVSDLLNGLREKFQHNKKQIEVQFDLEEGVYLHTDHIGFMSVVINLIENAIKYSEAGTKVLVQLRSDEAYVHLHISDEGIGIPDNEKQKVFEKFYRIGSEETRKTKGTGLGLYIVKRFVQIFDGHIEVKNNQPRGTVFELALPK